MAPSEPCIIEVALSCRPDRNETAPRTLEDHITQGLACIDAGASIVHMHLPDLKLPAQQAAEQYLVCFRPWLERDPDVLALPTNGWGDTVEDRFAHQVLLAGAGALRMAFVDPGA